ncbi:hypothetical protein T02_5919 [Trichinella nativa]|uniref:Uncharacterized protein n=1 Tax=Trichinella nativa TaxID=6335 RepID=A0A0V1KXX0_9BILA|nr:hypothetical protein T02_375 [Trichinella nativa]KRZ56188.1 hypothetical protein T02_5919 [Trichinella nativa]
MVFRMPSDRLHGQIRRANESKAYPGQPFRSGLQQVVQGNIPKPCGPVENNAALNLSGAPFLIHSMMWQVPGAPQRSRIRSVFRPTVVQVRLDNRGVLPPSYRIPFQLPLDQTEPLLSDRIIIRQFLFQSRRTVYRTPSNERFRSNSSRSKPDRDCSSSEEIPMASSSQNFRSSWAHSVSADLSAATVGDGICEAVCGPQITHPRQVSTATGSSSPARTIVDPSILKK